MKKNLVLILLLGVFLMSGCASHRQAKYSSSANVIYTNAPMLDALDASCIALKNIGYKIEKKDAEKFVVEASCANLLTGHTPVHAEINITQEASGTKIVCSVFQPGAIKTWDVIGYYSAENVYKEIARILASEEISYRNASKARKKKQSEKSRNEE